MLALVTIPSMQFCGPEFPELLSQIHICFHRLNTPWNCGILFNTPYWKVNTTVLRSQTVSCRKIASCINLYRDYGMYKNNVTSQARTDKKSECEWLPTLAYQIPLIIDKSSLNLTRFCVSRLYISPCSCTPWPCQDCSGLATTVLFHISHSSTARM